MPQLVIIRGPSGFGKSTLANKEFVSQGYNHVESDMFFMEGGVYKFNPNKLRDAHAWCQKQVELFLRSGKDVVVSNTFTRKWEVQFYLDLAAKLGIQPRIIRMTKEYGNTHNVPANVVQQMIDRMEVFSNEETR